MAVRVKGWWVRSALLESLMARTISGTSLDREWRAGTLAAALAAMVMFALAWGCQNDAARLGPLVIGQLVGEFPNPEELVVESGHAPADSAEFENTGLDPAELAPADTRLYFRVDDLGDIWKKKDEPDRLVTEIIRKVKSDENTRLMTDLPGQFGMDLPTFYQTYFGKTVALIAASPKASPAVILTRVDPAAAAKVRAQKDFKPAGRWGRFEMFKLADDSKLIGVSEQWMALGLAGHAEHMERVLSRTGAETYSLAKDATYREWMAKMPRPRSAVLYINDVAHKNIHVAVGVKTDYGATLHYQAEIEKVEDFYKLTKPVSEADFGPLPEEAISAVSFNLHEPDPKGMMILNLILFPRNLKDDVMPKIEPPVIFFLGKLAPDEVKPNPGFQVPVVGLAIKMKDPTVAVELDKLLNGIRFFGKLADLNVLGSLAGPDGMKFGELDYHSADFGKTLTGNVQSRSLSRLVAMPEHAGLTRISYGRVGNWYVVSTQDAFFRKCVDANAGKGRRITDLENFDAFRLQRREKLLLSSVTKADQLASLVRSVSDYWKKVRQDNPPMAQAKPPMPEVKPMAKPDAAADKKPGEESYDRPLDWFIDVIKHHKSFSVQLWRGEKNLLEGKVEILR